MCAQRNIRSLKQLVSMNDDDRRLLLRQLSDSEYRDVLSVCAMMPSVDITAHCEGLLANFGLTRQSYVADFASSAQSTISTGRSLWSSKIW